MLQINNLSKTYLDGKKKTEAISGLTVDIKKNDFTVFVGPSGCGKTTFLKCIGGLLEPTSGEIRLSGKAILRPQKEIGMVFQEFSLFSWLTVKENIEFGLKIKNTPVTKQRGIVQHYLETTQLFGFEGMYPNSLSGGMKQRVAIARTLANDPKVILMDEPFGSLDSLMRSKMQEFLTELWEKEHKTILFVTHDVEEALFLADTIHVLTKRPATIKRTFSVDFKRPRKHSLKRTKMFFNLRNEIIDLLDD